MPRSVTLASARGSERVSAAQVTGEFFDVLGAAPAKGRALGPADETADAPPVVVLGHGLWQRRFGGDPVAVGRTLTINDTPTTIMKSLGLGPLHGYGIIQRIWRSPTRCSRSSRARSTRRFYNTLGWGRHRLRGNP